MVNMRRCRISLFQWFLEHWYLREPSLAWSDSKKEHNSSWNYCSLLAPCNFVNSVMDEVSSTDSDWSTSSVVFMVHTIQDRAEHFQYLRCWSRFLFAVYFPLHSSPQLSIFTINLHNGLFPSERITTSKMLNFFILLNHCEKITFSLDWTLGWPTGLEKDLPKDWWGHSLYRNPPVSLVIIFWPTVMSHDIT